MGILGGAKIDGIPEPKKDEAICAVDSPLPVTQDKIVLEEFEFSISSRNNINFEFMDQAFADEGTQKRFREHLVIVSNDDFTYFVRHATEVVARIGLDYERKTVRTGALFYEEYLPTETLLYSLVLCSKSRRKNHERSADQILRWLMNQNIKFLQIGAGETVGKGFCAINITIPDAGAES